MISRREGRDGNESGGKWEREVKLEKPHLVKSMALHFDRGSVSIGSRMVGTCVSGFTPNHLSQDRIIWLCAEKHHSGSSKGATENRPCSTTLLPLK